MTISVSLTTVPKIPGMRRPAKPLRELAGIAAEATLARVTFTDYLVAATSQAARARATAAGGPVSLLHQQPQPATQPRQSSIKGPFCCQADFADRRMLFFYIRKLIKLKQNPGWLLIRLLQAGVRVGGGAGFNTGLGRRRSVLVRNKNKDVKRVS